MPVRLEQRGSSYPSGQARGIVLTIDPELPPPQEHPFN